MRLSESLRQDGIRRGSSFSDHQLGLDPAAPKLKRCMDIAKTRSKVARRDAEVGFKDCLVEG